MRLRKEGLKMEEIRNHFGVYGTCFKENRLLCINKNAGPYQNRYDLPGGSQQYGEGLTETLAREILEETGHKLLKFSNNRIYDSFVHEVGKNFTVHHIFALYDVTLSTEAKPLPNFVADGKNDSDGLIWVPLNEINSENSSPLVNKVKDETLKVNKYMDASIYKKWEIVKK